MTTPVNPLPFWFDEGAAVPGADAEALSELEAKVGQVLPKELYGLLLVRDGGVSNYGAFSRTGVRIPVPAFFSVEEIGAAFRSSEFFGTPKGVLAIGGGAHEWLGLDYRDGAEPSVVFQDHEEAPLEFVAHSFSEFLGGLQED